MTIALVEVIFLPLFIQWQILPLTSSFQNSPPLACSQQTSLLLACSQQTSLLLACSQQTSLPWPSRLLASSLYISLLLVSSPQTSIPWTSCLQTSLLQASSAQPSRHQAFLCTLYDEACAGARTLSVSLLATLPGPARIRNQKIGVTRLNY